MKFQMWLIPVSLLALTACDKDEKTFMVGTLERDRVEISVESNEPIIAIHVQDGQMMKTGDLILEQDPARLENLLAQQTALSAQADARLAELQRGPRQETIREARAQFESAQATTINAVANMKRAKEVFDRNLSDQQTLDFAVTHWKTAMAAEKAAGESLDRLLR
jgi:HlyD family secretion protein